MYLKSSVQQVLNNKSQNVETKPDSVLISCFSFCLDINIHNYIILNQRHNWYMYINDIVYNWVPLERIL